MRVRLGVVAGLFLLVTGVVPASAGPPSGPATRSGASGPSGAVPRATCGAGDHPERDLQGRVPPADHADGYSDVPYTCNTALVAHLGESGGFKVERYVDPETGQECAYYDSTLLFPIDAVGTQGVQVVDMSDPAHPVHTDSLVTPAMLSPHESLLLNQERGLLAAVMGNPATYPGLIDVYDVTDDCAHPRLLTLVPSAAGILGHESGFSTDGRTFYATSLGTGNITAVDLTNPAVPLPLWTGLHSSHGMSLSADGNRAYLAARADAADGGANPAGLIILDVSQIQARVPNPQVTVVGRLHWDDVTIPQNTIPVTIGGHAYLLEVDEFAGGPVPSGEPDAPVGIARVIDIADETHPQVVARIPLEVHLPEHRAEVMQDPNAGPPQALVGGYASHYCGVPQLVDPGIMACTMIESGLRVFDIRDPLHPTEIAYFNSAGFPETGDPEATAMSLSRPTFAPERGEIWYTDGNTGFYVVRVTNGVWPFTSDAVVAPTTTGAAPSVPAAAPAPTGAGGSLVRTGVAVPLGAALLLLLGALAARRARAVA